MASDEALAGCLLNRSQQETELVPLWIGEHHPGRVGRLSDIDLGRPQRQQSLQFLTLTGAVGPEV